MLKSIKHHKCRCRIHWWREQCLGKHNLSTTQYNETLLNTEIIGHMSHSAKRPNRNDIKNLIVDIRREFAVSGLPNHVRRRKSYVDFYHECMMNEDYLMLFQVAPISYIGLMMVSLLREKCPCKQFDPEFFGSYVAQYIHYYKALHLRGITISKSHIGLIVRFYRMERITNYYKNWCTIYDDLVEFFETAYSDWDDIIGSESVQSKTWEGIYLYC